MQLPTPERLAVLAGCILIACCAAGRAESEDVVLTLGEGWGVVREMRTVELASGEQDVLLDDIPEEADLATMVVRSRRGTLDVRSWGWEGEGAVAVVPAGVSVAGDGGSVSWRPGGAPLPAPRAAAGARRLRCRLYTPTAGRRALELVYRFGGARWESHYRAVVRGEMGQSKENLGVDFRGVVRIENGTARAFSRAVVRLVGPGRAGSQAAAAEPGILMLDEDNPLAGLWNKPAPIPQPQNTYRLPGRVDIPARGATDAVLVDAVRVPAAPLYAMTSEALPAVPGSESGPLRKIIVFKNTSAQGLGWVLPPGPVEVFVGPMSRGMVPGARIPYTPVDDEIRLDLGPAPDVFGRRQPVGQSEVAEGFYQLVQELVVENKRPIAVAVEIDEKPPTTLEWSLTHSTGNCIARAKRLVFTPVVQPGSQVRIQYTIKVRQPSQ